MGRYNIHFDRILCMYCLMIDSIDISLLVASLFNPIYFLPAMFALGFAYDGILREALFQMKYYNYFPSSSLELAKILYYSGAALIAMLAILISPLASISFTIAFILMQVINGARYKESLLKGEADMKYDLYMFIPLFFGVLILFYVSVAL
ncbi:MAG: hypothetical protein QW478_04965 [Candidatus Micrarchaeaceae archaeon]